jgi:hypothetical protein
MRAAEGRRLTPARAIAHNASQEAVAIGAGE